jgi:phage terminase large subunit GpA-like protein
MTAWRPDPLLNVSEWADANVVLSTTDSSEPGPFRTSRTPYVREIVDTLSPHHPAERVVWMSGAQVGKTRAGLNWIGYTIDVVPGPFLFVSPTVDAAKKVSKQRLTPMIEATPVLAGKVSEARSRDSGNTMFEKEFPGGILLMTGANSGVGLRSMPIGKLYLDEIDAYPADVDGEGDPVSLAEKRTANFPRRKIFMTSTPTIKGLSRIEKEFLRSDQRRYFVPCPSCKTMQWLKWRDEAGRYHIVWINEAEREAGYACEGCDEIIPESSKTWMLEHGQWRATAPGDGITVGYHLSALYSPLGWRSWGSIYAEFLDVKDDASRLKTWVNTVLGETWEEDGERPPRLNDRVEEYAAEVPAGVAVLVAAVDVQGSWLECAVKGYGAGEESWLIAHQQFLGDPGQEQVWFELDEFLQRKFVHASGTEFKISATAIDSGGHHTDIVYKFCWVRVGRRIGAVKGASQRAKEILSRPTMNNRYRARLFMVGTDTAKDLIFSRMRIRQPGPGYMHLPSWVDEEYLSQLTSEVAVRRYVRGRGTVREYVKTRERNEALDLEVYSLAALYMLGEHARRKLADRAAALATVNSRTDDPEGAMAPAINEAVPASEMIASRSVRARLPWVPRRSPARLGRGWATSWRA